MNWAVVETIHPHRNKFVRSVKIKSTGESKLTCYDNPVWAKNVIYLIKRRPEDWRGCGVRNWKLANCAWKEITYNVLNTCIYIHVLNAMISNFVDQILWYINILILNTLHWYPEETQRNYHSVANFLYHFRGRKKAHVQLLGLRRFCSYALQGKIEVQVVSEISKVSKTMSWKHRCKPCILDSRQYLRVNEVVDKAWTLHTNWVLIPVINILVGATEN